MDPIKLISFLCQNNKKVHALNVAVTNFGHRGEKGIQIMSTTTTLLKSL
jgi:hypothetical protein